ncbi:MAG TPA: RNA methyltransferase [Azospira sp.]|nr:RNA methyltransferase [Azospira sp.]
MKTISSRDNPRFKRLRKWATQHRARRDDGVIVLDGLHLIEALTAAGGSLTELVVSSSGAARPEIAAWLAEYGERDVLLLPDALLAEVAATETPSGILAVAAAPVPAGGPATDVDCVLLDGVQDPGNVGTLLRTAAAAGIRQALLAPGCADPWAPKTLRAGQGAQFLLTIHEAVDLAGFLAEFSGNGVVTRLDAPQTLWETPLDGPLAWVFGAEGQGVSATVAAAATVAVRIPMPGATESLNVAAAAAICLFEKVRRRQGEAKRPA